MTIQELSAFIGPNSAPAFICDGREFICPHMTSMSGDSCIVYLVTKRGRQYLSDLGTTVALWRNNRGREPSAQQLECMTQICRTEGCRMVDGEILCRLPTDSVVSAFWEFCKAQALVCEVGRRQ